MVFLVFSSIIVKMKIKRYSSNTTNLRHGRNQLVGQRVHAFGIRNVLVVVRIYVLKNGTDLTVCLGGVHVSDQHTHLILVQHTVLVRVVDLKCVVELTQKTILTS